MLYATTGSKIDTFTPQRAIRENRAPEGGLFVPLRLPWYSAEQIAALAQRPPGENLARVLNEFFPGKLTGKDVEFLLGKDFFRINLLSHRIAAAELWRNPDGSFDRIVRLLTERLSAEPGLVRPGEWMYVAVRIGLLFALFGELERLGLADPETPVDVALGTGHFIAPMAAWYARKMGLPIGTVVCGCNENGGVWDLLRRGQMRTDLARVRTITPAWDIPLPGSLERLIYETLGREEAVRYRETCQARGLYQITPEQQERLSDGIFASVVSGKRLADVMPNVFRTNGYILCPYSALVYSALLDFRASPGKNGLALMLCEQSPLQREDGICQALGISREELREKLDQG